MYGHLTFFRKGLILLFSIFVISSTLAQVADSNSPSAILGTDIFSWPSTYRTSSNPHYWKNRKPRENYWQQDVHYKIEGRINDTANSIYCPRYELTYWNNSPDTLYDLYFHLNENAFQPGSYYEDLSKNNKVPVKFGPNEKMSLGTKVDNLFVNGNKVETTLDNTILRVKLSTPLPPNDSLVVTCAFTTWWDVGTMRRRNKYFETLKGLKHFDGVHWYPIVCVYDAKFGWTTDQHLDKEFYANFGTFDVSLTFPQEYIVDATGVLMNQADALPEDLRKKIDLKNFSKKVHPDSVSKPVLREPGKFKTWIFHADNVHNFAFTADPLYRIGERTWNGIKVVTLAQEQNAYGWQLSGWFTEQVIKTYSLDLGMYAWPKIIVADAKDGMEYPMLTLDNGTYPSHQGLLAHEVGHMWFYGMVGSNETYRAMMDEGFTQFLTVWSQDKILGAVRDRMGPTKYYDRFVDSSNTRYENLYYPYLNHVIEHYDEPLNTHSSGFNGAIRHGGNYGLTYYKTGVMLYNLRYVLGDELFGNAMKNYFNQWKFCHPYPEDFRQSIIDYTHSDLNWFFDQWMETTKYIDYAIDKVKYLDKKHEVTSDTSATGLVMMTEGDTYTYSIRLRRKGRMHMPLDITVIDKDSNVQQLHIPNTWFVKKTSAKVLDKWYGWDLLKPTYTFTVQLPTKLSSVSIDPSLQLADKDLTNNYYGKTRFRQWQWDHRIPNGVRWDRQRNFLRPALWYGGRDGVQAGIHGEGSYFGKHQYSFSVFGNTTLGSQEIQDYSFFIPVSFYAFHRHSTHNFWRHTWAGAYWQHYGGLTKAEPFFEKIFRKQDQRNQVFQRLYISLRYWLPSQDIRDYTYYNVWTPGLVNGSINARFTHNYVYGKGRGEISLGGRSSSFFSDYNYAYAHLHSLNKWAYKITEWRSRVYAQLPWTNGLYPGASTLGAFGANGEEISDHKLLRATGIIPNYWMSFSRTGSLFHAQGGLNLRGYNGRSLYKDPSFVAFGFGGAAWNMEIEFDKLVKFNPKFLSKYFKLDTYVFADAGVLNYSAAMKHNTWTNLLADAGLGTALTLKLPYYNIQPIVIRFDVPLWLSNPAPTEKAFGPRYVLGLGRAF